MSTASATQADSEPRTLVDELLAEQRSLTAVERFAQAHERDDSPRQAKFYRDLIPLNLPAAGEQYAFEVDLDKCSACKACVTACHSLNGLDDQETWRDVGLLYSEDWRAPFQANITTACHHCVDPGCLSGCPVLAYDKDPVTGIVRHLDDQCIGCQYCVMKCPYDAPKYSAKRGIVRKCDMCGNRLGQGEAPACVQACPSQAIRITLVNQFAVSARFDTARLAAANRPENAFLPASPSPSHTFPTTCYKSSRPLPAGLLAGDHSRVSPAHSHLPLVFMLVLSQLAVGASAAAIFLAPAKWFALAAVGLGTLGIGCGTFHLGQPLKAWRAFLGWRTSWFSREVIAFGGFVPLAGASAVSFWVPQFAVFQIPAACLAFLAGFGAVVCSAMIYADTRREFWRPSQSFGKFFGTTLLLGAALALAFSILPGSANAVKNVPPLAGLLIVVSLVKLSFEYRIFDHLVDEETPAPSPLNKTARLMDGELGKFARLRVVCGVMGGLVLPVLLAMGGFPFNWPSVWFALAMLTLCLLGELLERYLFFTAVAPAKMPGGFAA